MVTETTGGGGAGLTIISESEWNVGTGIDSNLNGGSAGARVITGPGSSSYSSTVKLDASTSNLFDSSSTLQSDGGVVYDDTTSMTDTKITIPEMDNSGAGDNLTQQGQTPSHQEANTHTYGMSDYVYYTADKVVEDANVSTDYRAEGGSGVFSSESTALITAGSSKNSCRTDYTARRTERATFYGNSTSTLSGALSTKYRDFSRPLGFGDANSTPTVESTSSAQIGSAI